MLQTPVQTDGLKTDGGGEEVEADSPISTSLCSPAAGALHQLAKVWRATKLG